METLNEKWSSISRGAKLLSVIALPAAGYGVARFLDEYRAWLAMGPGGLPHNILGFSINILITVGFARKETKSTWMYDEPEKYATGWKEASDDEKEKAKKSFLKTSLPQRSGRESKALHFNAPQREKNIGDYFDPTLKEKYLKSYQSLGDKYGDSMTWSTSVLERQGQAIFLKDNYTVPTLVASCKREVLHIHESDMSAHVLLSLADAKEVIAKGWGERHRMSSTLLPLQYTFIYLPRNADEMDITVKILEAGIEYAKSTGLST